jgi:S-adenosylmethionine:tRNA ribosyltransferase-isomerase
MSADRDQAEAELAALDFELPSERIAQHPAAQRDAARLLVLDRASGARRHATVAELATWLQPGDLLVRNVSRVLPARLRGTKATGGAAEALLLGPAPDAPGGFRALVRCGGRLRVGQKLRFARAAERLDAELTALHGDGEATLVFGAGPSPYALGETPLPPYIRREAARTEDAERYQTVYARVPGSVAAPTAGLHFTAALDRALAARGVATAELVLHVGPGTFRPPRAEDLARGRLHAEPFELPEATAAAIARTRAAGGRVVAVGTTTTRVLEHCAAAEGGLLAGCGETELLLRPGVRFRVVDALLTNFHLPRSSLLLLVAAFAGREPVLAAYREAVERGYRFYSYGDAMLVL